MAAIVIVIFTVLLQFFANAVDVPNVKLSDGREMPAVALGTWLGESVKPHDLEVEAAVRWALAAGYRHVDTAWIYGIEDQVGRALGAVPREELFITTKLWNAYHARSAVVPALRASLKALQLDYVDLYLIHWPVAYFDNKTIDNTDYLDTWRGMIDAKNLGLTRSIGISNFNQAMIERILESGLEKPTVLQVELNLNLQQPELVSFCKSNDIVVTAYTPFGSIFQWKAMEDAPGPRIDDPALVDIAHKYNKTVPQVVLRYLLELGVVPLPKSLTKTRIEQNLDIFDFYLTEDEKNLMRSYDKNYRTLPQYKWLDHPYYPFEKPESV